jgi:hypothetical protein
LSCDFSYLCMGIMEQTNPKNDRELRERDSKEPVNGGDGGEESREARSDLGRSSPRVPASSKGKSRTARIQRKRRPQADAPAGSGSFEPSLYINRELSLLEFILRVLEEALYERHPLLEREISGDRRLNSMNSSRSALPRSRNRFSPMSRIFSRRAPYRSSSSRRSTSGCR